MESEGCRWQSTGPRNTNRVKFHPADELAKQSESQRLHSYGNSNAAGRWDKGCWSSHVRSHGRLDFFLEAWRKACREKSAEVIVDMDSNLLKEKKKPEAYELTVYLTLLKVARKWMVPKEGNTRTVSAGNLAVQILNRVAKQKAWKWTNTRKERMAHSR